jgi:Aspartyl/Asparaginyl beta-hydroxylase
MEKMLMFIKRLDIESDSNNLFRSATELFDIAHEPWWAINQISLKSRVNSSDPWRDGTGSLTNRATGEILATEGDFQHWNISQDNPIRLAITQLQNHLNIPLGRARIMRLLPHAGLSVHRDRELRYHLVLKTNPKAFIAHNVTDTNPLRSDIPTAAIAYHLPQDNIWYQIDTRETHWVYNGGEEERIHLVVCGQ